MFKTNDVLLFQGDSITEASRNHGVPAGDILALGSGYAGHAAAVMMRQNPALALSICNRGVSGNKVYQLNERWERDCLAIKPDVLSILIGVNDYCSVFREGYCGTIKDYERDYNALLDRTRAALPDVKLILGEPFLLEAGDITASRVEALKVYQGVAHRTAEKYQAVWIPYQKVFNDALKDAPAKYWALDGVHPTPAGHWLMAEAWLKTIDWRTTVS